MLYDAYWIWDQIRDTLLIYQFGYLKIGAFKNKLKKIILKRQSMGDPVEWCSEILNYKLTLLLLLACHMTSFKLF